MGGGFDPIGSRPRGSYAPDMSLSLLFWVLYILAFFFSAYLNRTNWPGWAGGNLLHFVLIGILGWAVFGAAIHR